MDSIPMNTCVSRYPSAPYAHHHTALWQLQPLLDAALEAQTLATGRVGVRHLVRIGIHLVLHRWYRHTLSPPVHTLDTCPSVVASRLPLGPILRVHQPGRGLRESLILLHKAGCSTAIVAGMVCVAWIFRVCTVPGARHPAASPFTWWSTNVGISVVQRFPLRSDDVRAASGALVAALPYLGSCRRAVGQEAWRVSGSPPSDG